MMMDRNFDESQIPEPCPSENESGPDGVVRCNARDKKEAWTRNLMVYLCQVIPWVLAISVAAAATVPGAKAPCEHLVGRHVELGKVIDLGRFEKKDCCILLLSDGGEIRVTRSMLGNEAPGSLPPERHLVLSTTPRNRSLHSNTVTVTQVDGE